MHIPVLASDDALLVIDKPAGVLSLPDGFDPTKPHLRALLEPEWGRLWMLHRLDRETSGVMALARTAQAHRRVNAQFERGAVEKVYLALVKGEVTWDQKVVTGPLRSGVGRRKRTIVDPQGGKEAMTDFRVLGRGGGYALLEARPHTGRTHQIRAHLYHLACPVVSDPLYGELQGEHLTLIPRLALHAFSLGLLHPASGEQVQYTAPLPLDLLVACKRLEIEI
jgi:tRNA pseudouridine32 synthase / 23S rRNA pseudouridine746 synthase